MCKVSLVIAGYNCAAFIEKCMRSIFNQDYTDFEVIFVDDGSRDSTADIVQQFKDKRLRYIYQENGGVSAARNLGIKVVSDSEYLMFVDSDDWLEQGCLKNFVSVVESTDADYVFSDWFEYVRRGEQLELVSCKLNDTFSGNIEKKKLVLHFLRSRSGGAPWAKLYKTRLIKEHSINFIEGLPFAEDYLFNLEYLQYAESVKYLQENLYTYNCSHIGARGKFRKNRMDITIKIEDYKRSLFPIPDEEEENAMFFELIEQMAAALYNLRNTSFSNKERRAEIKKARLWWKKQDIRFISILKSDVGIKPKLLCAISMIGSNNPKG